jgi:hypothetical protein
MGTSSKSRVVPPSTRRRISSKLAPRLVKTLAAGVQTKMWTALRAASQCDAGRKLLSAVFGGDGLKDGLAKSYDSLSRALDMATQRGLFD